MTTYKEVNDEQNNGTSPHSKNSKKRKVQEDFSKKKKLKSEPKSKKNMNKKEFFKPPTVEELNNLKMTENLYNNNLFRLQIEEMLKEISIKEKRKKLFDSWLKDLENYLNNLPNYENITLSEISKCQKKKKMTPEDQFMWTLKTKKYPNLFETDQNVKMSFQKPLNYKYFGLFECNALVGPDLETCLILEMPKECFHHKDYLNNRYLVKRLYYLYYIAETLPVPNKKIVYHESNILMPILQIQSDLQPKGTVKIYIVPPEDYFKATRGLPNVNNVKKDLFRCDIKDNDVFNSTPTVLYNSILCYDITLKENAEFIKSSIGNEKNIQEGIRLLTVWLKQRAFNVGFGAFSFDILAYFIAYLFTTKKINKFMSSYQVIRNFWSFLATTDLENEPIALGDVEKESLDLFKQYFPLVFLDKTGCFNLIAFLDVNIYKAVRFESTLALRGLEDYRENIFTDLFLIKHPLPLQCELIVDLTESIDEIIAKKVSNLTDKEKVLSIGFQPFQELTHIFKLLHKALTKRILHIVPYVEVEFSNIHGPQFTKLLFGIKLNPETAFNFIEKGPELHNHIEAEKFRKFWGFLASDRRFQDGSTHVAVYFKRTTMRGKRNIPKRIVKYILDETLNLKFDIYYDEFEQFIIPRGIELPFKVGTNEEASLKVITLADELSQKLRNGQMSLNISGILGLSDVFSYTDVFPPIANSQFPKSFTKLKQKHLVLDPKNCTELPYYLKPIDLIVNLEHSSKWPNDLEAVRHVKTSFYLEMSKMLQDKYNIVSNVNNNFLQVSYGGAIFRFRLFVQKEVSLMKKVTADDGAVAYMDNKSSIEYEKTLKILPKVTIALKGLHMQYSSYGPATALVKRWLRSQLIDDYLFPDIVINLITASFYLNYHNHPCTPQIAFMRFLDYVARNDWEVQPVIVNFNDEISKADLAELDSQFQKHKATLQPLYIIMPYDEGQSLFTKTSPTKEVIDRVQELALSATDLNTLRLTDTHFNGTHAHLFQVNLKGYDFKIHLNKARNVRKHEKLDMEQKNQFVIPKCEEEQKIIPVVDFDPFALYLQELRENFGELATFFFDSYGGNLIMGLWNPVVKNKKEFKVSAVNGRLLKDEKLIINKEAIIEDFHILGKGLVDYIETNSRDSEFEENVTESAIE
ncbi:hypothetical protein ABEB36_006825 [Hypothenemus hampei]|uniref:Nucleolar protein 6 n=1 Tax=Hypothenemus hampei TaxID=57062 RepID=A0ABD1ESD6_HYPHA